MTAATIYLLRHAEKPDPAQLTSGVDDHGNPDKRSLTPRGWQRAGALAVWLRDARNIPVPISRVYASRAEGKHDDPGDDDDTSKSKRPVQTVTPFAERAGLEIVTRFTKGGEPQLAGELAGLDGVTLVGWQHEAIPALVVAVAPGVKKQVPAKWPGERFDLVWVLKRDDRDAAWVFSQLVQGVLEGDGDEAG